MSLYENGSPHENGHEGDGADGLRARLVRVGVELVNSEGAQALSLREIARRAGVSHGAPRRHFPTHLDLLSAIARQGFAELAARVAGEDPEGAAPRERIEVLARVYLDFAGERRGMYELMFRHDLLESGRLGLRETSLPLFAHLTGLVARVRPEADATLLTGALWANLHGIAQLWHWGSLRLATGADTPAPLLATALTAHLGPAGAAARDAGLGPGEPAALGARLAPGESAALGARVGPGEPVADPVKPTALDARSGPGESSAPEAALGPVEATAFDAPPAPGEPTP